MPEKKPCRLRRKHLLPAGILVIAVGILLLLVRNWPRPAFGVVDENVIVAAPAGQDVGDALVITQGRLDYRRGELALVIPSIAVSTAVGESTLPDVLRQLPGLYEFSQLPGEGDVNVSIAAHRDVYGKEFYALDKLAPGDYLYLLHRDKVYRYRYLDTRIVPPDRWEVIRRQGFSCLTLTTCDPVGTTLNRLILRAELVDVEPYRVENEFPPNDLAPAEHAASAQSPLP